MKIYEIFMKFMKFHETFMKFMNVFEKFMKNHETFQKKGVAVAVVNVIKKGSKSCCMKTFTIFLKLEETGQNRAPDTVRGIKATKWVPPGAQRVPCQGSSLRSSSLRGTMLMTARRPFG